MILEIKVNMPKNNIRALSNLGPKQICIFKCLNVGGGGGGGVCMC